VVGDRAVRVAGLFQQSSMTGRGTVGFVAEPTVALPLRTQADHQMLLVVGPCVPVNASERAPSRGGGQAA
jgi:hypothetical protein